MSRKESDRQRIQDINDFEKDIHYSTRYHDDFHEFRHVVLPKTIAKYVPKDRLMTEDEWRSLGVRQSPGWHQYMIHEPEPHILLFKRDYVAEDTTTTTKKKQEKQGGMVGAA